MKPLTAIYPELMPQSAFDADLSAFRCEGCAGHISKQEESESQIWHEKPLVDCSLCGETQTGSITVEPSSSSLLLQGEAERTIWFHATYVDDWFEKISTGHGMEGESGDFLYVHVGSEAAARDIASDKYFNNFEEFESLSLYQVRLKSGALVSSRIVNDDETWRDFGSVTEESAVAIGGDVVRYLNRWESPGSISLLVDARQLELVKVTELKNPRFVESSETDMELCEVFA